MVRSLEQVEFLSPADRCPTVVHPQLAVNVFGVGMQRVQRHDELARHFRAVQVGSKQAQHVQFTFAQWLNEILEFGVWILGDSSSDALSPFDG